MSAGTVLRRGIALALLAAAWGLGWVYPVGGLWLGAAGTAVALLCAWRPWWAPGVLAAVAPLPNLAPWSGWILVDEFDVAVFSALAGVLWARLEGGRPSKVAAALLGLAALVWAAGVIRPLWGIPPLDANALSTYETPWNAVRVGKGFFYALALVVLVARRGGASAVLSALRWGFAIGGIVVGVAVLWERGVFSDLATARHYWEAFSGLLDVTRRYRATGWFAQMHLGGTSFDGYLVLAWPFALSLAFAPGLRWPSRTVAGCGAFLLAYAVAVSFTRTTYMAAAASVAVLMLLLPRGGKGAVTRWHVMLWGAAGVVLLGAFWVLFRRGGYFAVAGGVGAVVGGTAVRWFVENVPGQWPRVVGLAIPVGAGALMFRGMTTSRWVSNPVQVALALACFGAMFLFLWGLALVRSKPRRLPDGAFLWGVGTGVMIFGIAATMLGGYRMTTRFGQVAEDWRTRVGHWKSVIHAMDSDPAARLFGQGLGRFPELYRTRVLGEPAGPPYGVSEENGNRFLRMRGQHYLLLGQRVPLKPSTPYLFRAKVRSPKSRAILPVKVERRNVLLDDYNPHTTVNVRISGATGDWTEVSAKVESGSFGGWSPVTQWPPVLELGYHSRGDVIEVDDVRIVSPKGENLLENGDFRAGLNRWYLYCDHDHLPWHVKNLFLHWFFEVGAAGVLVIGALLLLALRASLGEGASSGPAAALVGFLVLGLTASPVDAPRVACLAYLLVFLAVVQPEGLGEAAGNGFRRRSGAGEWVR